MVSTAVVEHNQTNAIDLDTDLRICRSNLQRYVFPHYQYNACCLSNISAPPMMTVYFTIPRLDPGRERLET